MRLFVFALRVLSVAFIATAALHLVFGLQADVMLGAPVPAAMAADPSLDSQNRFYGITFSLLGVALFISSTDLDRYRPIILAVLGYFFWRAWRECSRGLSTASLPL